MIRKMKPRFKADSMMQWIECKTFVNVPLVPEISGAVYLAQPGLTSGRAGQGRQACNLSNPGEFRILKKFTVQ